MKDAASTAAPPLEKWHIGHPTNGRKVGILKASTRDRKDPNRIQYILVLTHGTDPPKATTLGDKEEAMGEILGRCTPYTVLAEHQQGTRQRLFTTTPCSTNRAVSAVRGEPACLP